MKQNVGMSWRFDSFWTLGSAMVLTLAVFLVLPLTQMLSSQVKRNIQVTKVDTALPPPPPTVETAPPPPEERPEEPKPKLDQQPQRLSLSDLDLDIGAGSGGILGESFQGFEDATAGLQDMSIFNVTDLDRAPVLVASPSPRYPRDLLREGVEGNVVIVFVLNEDGQVEDPRVESSSNPEFEKPALDAVLRWRFKPGMKGGEPVRTHMRLPIRFKINA